MTEPLVCAVMLTRNRPELARRTVECFRSQTYQNKYLLVFDSGEEKLVLGNMNEHRVWDAGFAGESIGALRNEANRRARAGAPPDVFVHWDDDDWSHPNRIAEQVALLQSSGADAVGYNEMLFWRARVANRALEIGFEAWLYRNRSPRYALGTSLCYWGKTWEAKPFPDLPKNKQSSGEDTIWIQGLDVKAVTSLPLMSVEEFRKAGPPVKLLEHQVRMIARIHGANSQSYDIERMIAGGSTEWTRVPPWDERVRETLK